MDVSNTMGLTMNEGEIAVERTCGVGLDTVRSDCFETDNGNGISTYACFWYVFADVGEDLMGKGCGSKRGMNYVYEWYKRGH